MCKKLIILCVVLVVVGLSMPALAVYIGFDENGNPNGCANPLKVDVASTYGTDDDKPVCGWQPWVLPGTWTGPINTTLANPYWETAEENPLVELDTYRKNAGVNTHVGFARSRSGGFAFANGTGEFGTAVKGFGTTYLKLTVGHLKPNTNYKIYLWSWDRQGRWATDPCNPNSKYGVWSTLNPKDWLDTHTWWPCGTNDPNGYGPINQPVDPETGKTNPALCIPDSNMPDGMENLALEHGKRIAIMAPDEVNDFLGGTLYRAIICDLPTGPTGTITLYGWMDPTDWTGSMHMPLQGFMVVPEPVTIALLGLGGLALIRRKRA